jgi:uncharacterized membrane protein YgdD (TMEM256/DUF423 family)
VAVGAGAFGAHILSGVQADWAKTGALYALTHAIAALTLVNRWPAPCISMLAGATILSVTLYAMALGAPTWLGAITPLGGALLIASWLWIALRSIRS